MSDVSLTPLSTADPRNDWLLGEQYRLRLMRADFGIVRPDFRAGVAEIDAASALARRPLETHPAADNRRSDLIKVNLTPFSMQKEKRVANDHLEVRGVAVEKGQARNSILPPLASIAERFEFVLQLAERLWCLG